MRKTLLATAGLFGLAVAAPAFAQSAPAPSDTTAPATDAAPPSATPDSTAPAPHKMAHHHHKTAANGEGETFAHEPGTGESGPASAKASNIDEADSHSEIAPHFPTPKAGHDARRGRLSRRSSARAGRAHHTGEAQQALEMAETRLLDRSTPADAAGQPMQNPQIQQINMARQALGHGDSKGAASAVKMALSANADAAQPGSGAGSMGTRGMGDASMPHAGMGTPPEMGSMSHGATNMAPTGAPMMAPSGAGPTPGASAAASVGGGAAGTGTADSAGGAK